VPTEIPAGCSSPQKASVARRGAAAAAATAVCDAFLHRELLLLDTDRLSLSRNRITDARATFESRRKTLLQSETIPGSNRWIALIDGRLRLHVVCAIVEARLSARSSTRSVVSYGFLLRREENKTDKTKK